MKITIYTVNAATIQKDVIDISNYYNVKYEAKPINDELLIII